MGTDSAYQFEESNGRLHVFYLVPNRNGEQRSLWRYGWMDRVNLAKFTFECGCTAEAERNKCFPMSQASLVSFQWNACFKDGMNKKLAEVGPGWNHSSSQATEQPATSASHESNSSERALTNDDVVKLSNAGLGDDVVISKIQQAPRETLDVSIESLIKLKADGISKSILDAMVRRAGQRKQNG